MDISALLHDTESYETTSDIDEWNIIKCIIWMVYGVWFLCIGLGIIVAETVDFCKIYVKDSRSRKDSDIVKIATHASQTSQSIPTSQTVSSVPLEVSGSQTNQRNRSPSRFRSSFHRCCPCMSPKLSILAQRKKIINKKMIVSY